MTSNPSDARVADEVRFVHCLILYFISSLVVSCGVFFGLDFIPQKTYNNFPGYSVSQPPESVLGSFANWDGVWYSDIARDGYVYNGDEGSYVVFFPGYPLLGRFVHGVTNMGVTLALLVVSHLSFLVCIWLLSIYVRGRFSDSAEVTQWILLVFVFSPASIFFRFAYAESLFCLLLLLILISIQRRWPAWFVALIVGAATSVRLVGVAMVPVLLLYVFTETRRAGPTLALRLKTLLPQLMYCAPLSVWGVIAYATYLGMTFGDPLVFVNNHEHFNEASRLDDPLRERVAALLVLEPVWSTYRSAGFLNGLINPLTELRYLNPIYFVATAVIVLVGIRQRLVNRYEAVAAAFLLLIPYVSKGYDNSMLGFARYSLVVLPVYLVAGNWAASLPTCYRVPVLVLSGSAMACFAALFAAWRIII